MGWLGPEEWQAVALSLKVSFWATILSLPLGLFTAYALARWEFRGKAILNSLVHVPLILPPVVTGYLLLIVFGTTGSLGRWLEGIGHRLRLSLDGGGAGGGGHGLSAHGARDAPVDRGGGSRP
jgi:molybdate transport system permease protein